MSTPIDPQRIQVWPLAERDSYIDGTKVMIDPASPPPPMGALQPRLEQLAEKIRAARSRKAAVMLAYGAHNIKNGCGPLLCELIRRGWVTHLATQGAGIIHDWEFAFLGRTSESVRNNIAIGRFGSWEETGRAINLSALVGGTMGIGLGAAIGEFVARDGLDLPSPILLEDGIRREPAHPFTAARADLMRAMREFGLMPGRLKVLHPFKKNCVSCAAYEKGIPFTVHIGMGYDIYVNHPLFHGGALGRASGLDARIFACSVLNLSGGVYLSVGSAIMSPQVFEKALSLANNLLLPEGKRIEGHTIAVVDLADGGGWDWSKCEPPASNPAFYLRYCKSFARMGGDLGYFQADNRLFLHNLLHLLG